MVNNASETVASDGRFRGQQSMKLISRLAFSLAASAAPASVAAAADYDPPIYVEDTLEVPVEIGSGWYLRGDVGYAFTSDIGDVTFRDFDPLTSTYGSGSFASQNLDTNITWGGGFGYSFNEWFRADLTADGFRTDFDGTTRSSDPCLDPVANPAYAGTGCRSENGAEVSAVSLMANAYADVGTVVGFTPYVGAGLGYSYVSWSGLDDSVFCTDGIGACPATGAIDTTHHGGENGWRFTYALMAGVAYDLSQNFKVDVGYKYRHIDGGDMFKGDDNGGSGGVNGPGSHGDIDQHEVRVGLRYEIW